MRKNCKQCDCELTLGNISIASKKLQTFRAICKSCRVRNVVSYQQKNSAHRREYANQYARKVGKVKQYPCLTCQNLCYKKYAKAFCSDKCRFMHYVQITDSCWLWNGAKNNQGYGKLSFKGNKTAIAHRVSYELFNGPIEDNMLICHQCDIKNCVKPAHLWIGTHLQNMMDMIEKDRQSSRLSPVDIYRIRELFEKFQVSRKKIMEKFNITDGYLSRIINRKVRNYV